MKSYIYFFATFLCLTLVKPIYSQVPTDGLIRYYPFNGNANDMVNNQNGTVNNATLTTDRYNNPNSAYQFNGVNSHIRLPTTGLFLNNYTYSAWVKLSSYPIASGSILAVGTYRPGNSGGGDQVLAYLSNPDRPLILGLGGGSYTSPTNQYLASQKQHVDLEKWYLATITRSNNSFKIYVNCELIDEVSIPPANLPFYGNNPEALIGMRESSKNYFSGIIDEVRIYNRALTASEVLSIYESGKVYECDEDECFITKEIKVNICEGDSVLIGEEYYNDVASIIDTILFPFLSGCDTVITTQIKLFSSFDTVIYTSTCNPADTGKIKVNLASIYGCDSIITTMTSLLASYDTTIFFNSCIPADTGIFKRNLISVNGCDSIINSVVFLLPSYDTVFYATSCNPADTGIRIISLKTINDCDSIIMFETNLLPSYDFTTNESSCNPADTGIFIESFKTKNNCDSIFNRIVSLKTVPIAQIIGENVKCVGEPLFLSVELQQPIDSVLWLNNESINSTIEINEGGNYIVKVFNECGEDFDSIEVKEIDCRCKYFIPNAFAPSGNKIEDAHFQIRTENIESVFVQVYSRWGEKVFESNDLNFKWDGFYRGQLMTTNVFGYYMELQCSQSNEIIIEKGNITLIR